jgi:polyisoprenoid-binding protein YceI
MSTKHFALIGIAGLIVLAGIAFAVFSLLFTNNTAPSGALTAIPVVVNTAVPSSATSQPVTTAASTSAAGGTTAAAKPTTGSTAASGAATTEAATPASTAASSGPAVYQIVPERSQVSFTISEELNGQPNTVVGTTTLVAGQLALNPQDLTQTQVGVIKVDARGLTTDSNRRNGAIRNFILNTNQYEYITFTPKAVTGLTGAALVGKPFTFQITGDLTIRDVIRSVTFDVTAQGAALDQITGTAKTTINRSDYSLTIPSVPNVANVGERVTLQIDFVANAAG